jgi:predicted metal-binding protein
MQPITPKWTNSGLVLVCERCFKERIPEEDPDKAAEIGHFHLRDWLKKRLKEDGHWGKVRAISTSCMDVCARRRVTVVIDPKTEGKAARAFVVDPIADKDELYKLIVRELGEPRSDETTMDRPSAGFERYEDEVTGR